MRVHHQAQPVQIRALVPLCHGVASSYSRRRRRRHPRLQTLVLVLVQYPRRLRCNMVRVRAQASRSRLARISTSRGRDMAPMGRLGRRCILLINIRVPRTRTNPSSIRPLRRPHPIILVINDSRPCTLNHPSHRPRFSIAPIMTRLSSSHIRTPPFRPNLRLSEQELRMPVVRLPVHPLCTRYHSIRHMRRCASLRLLSRIRLNSISSSRDRDRGRGISNSSRL